jgi:hypothetical protein
MYADTFTKMSNMWMKSGVRSASAYPGKYTTLRDGSSIYHPRQLKQNPNLGNKSKRIPSTPLVIVVNNGETLTTIL